MPPGKRNPISCNYCPEKKRRKQDFASQSKLDQHLQTCKNNTTRNNKSSEGQEEVRNVNASNFYSESSVLVNNQRYHPSNIETTPSTSILIIENNANEISNNAPFDEDIAITNNLQVSDPLSEAVWDADSDIAYYSNPTSPMGESSVCDDGHQSLIKYGQYQVSYVPFRSKQNLI